MERFIVCQIELSTISPSFRCGGEYGGFPDPVKNNNRSVNGVANHRKERRHKGRIHFKLQKGEPTERDHDVDDKGDNGGKGKVMLQSGS